MVVREVWGLNKEACIQALTGMGPFATQAVRPPR